MRRLTLLTALLSLLPLEAARQWQTVEVDVKGYASREVELRLVQGVLLPLPKCPGNALWRKISLE